MTGIKVVGITASEFDEAHFQSWLGETSPELFREYLSPSSEARRALLSNRFHVLFTKSASEIRLCMRGRDHLALIGFERLDWDSQHFGVACGRLSPYCHSCGLSHAEQLEIHKSMIALGIEWARHNGIKVLQRRLLSSRLQEINVLEDLGFHMVDNVVTLAAPIKNILSAPSTLEDNVTFRSPVKSELGALMSMTRGAFPHSRFLNDRILPVELGDDLYLKWIAKLFDDATESAAAAAANQGIIEALVENRIAGYAAYRIDRESTRMFGKSIATIELIVVEPAHQGMGVGQGLFREVSRRLHNSGVDVLESSTWINQRVALASNQKAGLRVRENLLTYHFHP